MRKLHDVFGVLEFLLERRLQNLIRLSGNELAHRLVDLRVPRIDERTLLDKRNRVERQLLPIADLRVNFEQVRMNEVNALTQPRNKDIQTVHAFWLPVGDNLPVSRAQAGLGASSVHHIH